MERARSSVSDTLFRPLRWGILILWVLCYVFMVRGSRHQIVEKFHQRLRISITDTDPAYKINAEASAITIRKQDGSQRIQIFVGQYLLLAGAGLILLSISWKWLVYIILFHVLASCINAGILYFYILFNWDLLFVSESLQRFIIPVISLGAIPLAYWNDREKVPDPA